MKPNDIRAHARNGIMNQDYNGFSDNFKKWMLSNGINATMDFPFVLFQKEDDLAQYTLTYGDSPIVTIEDEIAAILRRAIDDANMNQIKRTSIATVIWDTYRIKS